MIDLETMAKNIALIPVILEQNTQIIEWQKKRDEELTTKRGVAKFLGKSESTINNYIARGLLKEGYHFNRKNGKILVFVVNAIYEFKEELGKGIAYEKVAV